MTLVSLTEEKFFSTFRGGDEGGEGRDYQFKLPSSIDGMIKFGHYIAILLENALWPDYYAKGPPTQPGNDYGGT